MKMRRKIALVTALMLMVTQTAFAASALKVYCLEAKSGKNSITLFWGRLNNTKYNIERLQNGKYIKLATVADDDEFTDSNLIAGKKYKYRITPIRNGKKGKSSIVSGFPKFEDPVLSSNGNTITWDDVPGAEFYNVYKGEVKVATTDEVMYQVSDTSEAYKIKAGKKVYSYTKYWNKKTKKWTTKKPLKKNWGKCTRRGNKHYGMKSYSVYKYIYSDFSNEVIISSDNPSGDGSDNPSGGTPDSKPNNPSGGNTGGGSTGGNTGGGSTGGNTPDVPATNNLNITNSSTFNSIDLSWNNINEATYYEVSGPKGTTVTNKTSHSDSDLKPDTQYKYTVKAVKEDESVIVSKSVTVKTKTVTSGAVTTISDWGKVGIEAANSNDEYTYNLYVKELGFSKALFRKNGTFKGKIELNLTDESLINEYKKVKGYDSADISKDTNQFIWELTPKNGGKTTTISVYPKQLDFDVFQIDKTCTLDYGNTTIYLGQKWSDEIDNALNEGSSGRVHYERKDLIETLEVNTQNWRGENKKLYDRHIYMYDVGDYDHFLEVEVEAGQITSWLTTQDNMGTQNGVTLRRGDKTTSRNGSISYRKPEWAETRFTDIDTGGAIMGGFGSKSDFFVNEEHTKTRDVTLNSETYYPDMNIEDEKEIGRHYINAARIAGRIGLKPLIRDSDAKEYFEYGGPVTIYDRTIKKNTTTCYGAQAWADTLKENNAGNDGVDFDHDVLYPKGPCANATLTARVGYAVLYASKGHFDGTGEIMAQCGGSGTGCFFPYLESAGHEPMFFNRDATHIGLGIIPGHYTVVQVGYKNKTPDKWYTNYAPQ